jgi:trigger factor
MVDEALDEELNRVRQRLQMQRTSLESYLRAQDQTEEELREELRPTVAKRLRNSLILRAIAEKEGIEVTDADIDAEVETIVTGAPNEEQLRKVYGGDRYMRTVLRNELFDQRLTDRLIELATEGRGAVLNAFDASLYPTPEPVAVAPSDDEDEDGDMAAAAEGDQLGLVAADGSEEAMEELAEIAAADDEPMEDDLPETGAATTIEDDANDATAGREAEVDQLELDAAGIAGAGDEVDGTTPFPGSVAATGDECPDDHPIKGNASSKIYHQIGQSSYNTTIPEICFATTDDAEAAGFRASKSSGSVD